MLNGNIENSKNIQNINPRTTVGCKTKQHDS